jgi:hypothetical protein
MEQAAGYILKGLKNETKEYMFPPLMRNLVIAGRSLPQSVREKILAKMATSD